jgi:hypothetical protein
MEVASINWWAILTAVLSSFVVGGVWYSPTFFLKPWLTMSKVDKPTFDSGLPKALLGDLVVSIAMALGLNQILGSFGATGIQQGMLVALLVWLGFVASTLLNSVTYEHRPIRYFAINAGNRLVVMVIMGAILAVWK